MGCDPEDVPVRDVTDLGHELGGEIGIETRHRSPACDLRARSEMDTGELFERTGCPRRSIRARRASYATTRTLEKETKITREQVIQKIKGEVELGGLPTLTFDPVRDPVAERRERKS